MVTSESEALCHLRALVEALSGAYISSWQSTAAWQKQLDSASDWLETMETNND